MAAFSDVYKGKTVLVTGHTGFKGSWLSLWLLELGAKVVGYALDPTGAEDNFSVTQLTEAMIDIRGDIRDEQKLREVFATYKPEIVFHLAAQPLVSESYKEPVYTYQVNVEGTIHVLECIRHTPSVKVGILVTTDKCYDNKEQWWGYKETDALGGYDPYSASKAGAEVAIQCWRNAFMNPKDYANHGKAIASVRAGNVIGGGDFAKNRILPDCIRALRHKQPIIIRNPRAVRPWQHVLEPLNGYLMLGEKLWQEPAKYSEAWNFGPDLRAICPVWDVAKRVVKAYGEGEVQVCQDQQDWHEAKVLNLDISKTVLKLGWKPVWDIDEAIKQTVAWYQNTEAIPYKALCFQQISIFKQQEAAKGSEVID